jgi:hypothetical protein
MSYFARVAGRLNATENHVFVVDAVVAVARTVPDEFLTVTSRLAGAVPRPKHFRTTGTPLD